MLILQQLPPKRPRRNWRDCYCASTARFSSYIPCHSSLEQRVLGLFNDWKRVGVPFTQTRYLPNELEGRIRFSDFLRFEEDWSVTNRERGTLIDKGISGTLSAEERTRLDALQAYADYHIERVSPRPTHVLDELENQLFSGSPTKGKTVR